MPYTVKKGSGPRPWKIVRKDTGKVVGSSTSKAEAQASVRARYAAEGGYEMGKRKGKRKPAVNQRGRRSNATT